MKERTRVFFVRRNDSGDAFRGQSYLEEELIGFMQYFDGPLDTVPPFRGIPWRRAGHLPFECPPPDTFLGFDYLAGIFLKCKNIRSALPTLLVQHLNFFFTNDSQY